MPEVNRISARGKILSYVTNSKSTLAGTDQKKQKSKLNFPRKSKAAKVRNR